MINRKLIRKKALVKYFHNLSFDEMKARELRVVKQLKMMTPEGKRELARSNYQKYREQILARSKERRLENPDEVRKADRERYARRKAKREANRKN